MFMIVILSSVFLLLLVNLILSFIEEFRNVNAGKGNIMTIKHEVWCVNDNEN